MTVNTLSLLLIIVISYSICYEDIFMLKLNSSTIVGKMMSTVLEDKPFAAFWKVPYAQTPLRGLRFKSPKIYHARFEQKTYDFSRPYNNTCSSGFSEDCLYLSIYMPITDNGTSYPVLVWIYEESNLHEPDFFIDEDILVITVSYRTSITGFLNTGDDFAEGNMGVKDIIMALKWIRENIILFNGDFNRVTVVGSGSAASSVGSLILSPIVEDLFTRVIIQSGSALSPADYRSNDFDTLNKLYRNLIGPDKFNRSRLYETLTKASIHELQAVSKDLFDSTEVRDNQRLINSFGPSVEIGRNAFMNKRPLDVYKRGMANSNVEVMMGYTSLESLSKLKGFVKNRKLLKYLNNNFQYLLPFEGAPDVYGSRRYMRIALKIMNFYFANGTITERSLRRYAKYVSDQIMYPLFRQARLHAQASCTNVYLYRFVFKGSLNIGWESVRELNYSGATASDEICYLFRCKSVNVYRSAEASDERQFIRKIARLWANFAKCGNPTPNKEDEFLGNLNWEPLRQGFRGMNLGKNLRMINIPEEKRIKFWDELKNEFFPDKFYDEL